MRFEEAQQLKPGALLAVRECMLYEDPENPERYALIDVVGTHGFIYRFAKLLPNETYPVQATSLATGKMMEFYAVEVEQVKEQEA